MTLSTIKESLLRQGARILRPDPVGHWVVLLLVAASALVGTVAWNLWVFEKVINGEAIATDMVASTTPVVSDQSTITAARALFESRAIEEEKYTNGTYSYSDPSQ